MPRQTSLLRRRAHGSSTPGSPMAPFDHTRRPVPGGARYTSAWCPQLRTKAWLALHGLPPHLRTERTCRSAVAGFRGIVRFHGNGGRVVVEARITRPEDVPWRIEARHGLRTWPVDVEILAHAPVGDDDEAAPPDARLVMCCSGPEHGDGEEEGIREVGKPKRATIPAPKPEYAGIPDGRGKARGAVQRPQSSICEAYTG